MNKCIFLDRDGVLNEEIGTYVYKREDLIIPQGMPEALQQLKKAGYLLVVITNQAGIAMGKYTRKEVLDCHSKIQEACGNVLDALYYCPHHPDYDTASLTRKPDSLMIEKAIAKFNIDRNQSWMVGDRQRDIEAGNKQQIKGIFISAQEPSPSTAIYNAKNLLEASRFILQSSTEA
ncbi:HAD family hydrolase [Cytophagaceae bacterium YF14B1]|uniref:D,D-heptose 1,7-bisphosphate phosphatase n=1 Tax=Xanthocytophaga flava TaxID=3048013 RepID=A0AAE3UC68_9BACT|nr:HAD family hydrolase [Xanthocytophaga flavus]MDJ1484444.1 HAD family hydrolase [Xanthocytophaga flavus]